jgi:alanyl-tRNA synthetase
MIDISGFSRELCGGTHVHATGDIGMMKIVAEASVAAGVRRIEAVTGRGVERYVIELESREQELAKLLRTQPADLADRVRKLQEQVSVLEKELKVARAKGAGGAKALASQVRDVGSLKLIAARVEAPDRETLSHWAEQERDRLGENGVVVLGCELDGKVTLVAAVSKALTPRVHAGKIVGKVSELVGGKGGGRPDFAQGGGTDVSALEKALASVEALLK